MSEPSFKLLQDLYKESMMAYGFDPQLLKFGEECSEASAAILKYFSYQTYCEHHGFTMDSEKRREVWEHILEEIVDVYLMVGQMRYYLNEQLQEQFDYKISRAFERLVEKKNLG